ncbi:hypothetical protein [Sphingopyxis sp. KK2]|uniref:hypothetical protein n=1 Tax=Sphingopyxis sp. KK2 TaxID=1855727 RepID=UPI00097E56E5|nr:hypothetical protein [Sphingopyxis sp. KK2]
MTNRPTLILAATAAALLVAACGSKSEQEVASGTYTDPETGETADYKVTKSADGEDGSISIKTEDGEMSFGGGASSAKLPKGFTPYPGATMTGGMAATGPGGEQSGMASFEVKGQAADVIAHYRKQAEAAGLKVASEVKAGDMMMFSAEPAGGGKSGVHVTATQAGDTVNGTVTFGN